MILRVELKEWHFPPQIASDRREDRFEDSRIEEEGRAEVEAKPPVAERRGPASDERLAFQDGDSKSRVGQEHRHCQTARSRADDDNPLRLRHRPASPTSDVQKLEPMSL